MKLEQTQLLHVNLGPLILPIILHVCAKHLVDFNDTAAFDGDGAALLPALLQLIRTALPFMIEAHHLEETSATSASRRNAGTMHLVVGDSVAFVGGASCSFL
jgi:hypothetical protein